MSKSAQRWKAEATLALTALIWGTTFVAVKQAIANISPIYFLALRFSFGSLCLGLLFLPAYKRATRQQLWRGFLGGGIAGLFLWIGYACQTVGLEYTTAGNSGFITGFYIVLVPLLSAAIYRHWPRPIEFGGILIATAGMVVLTLPSLDKNLRPNKGDLLTVGCAVAYSFHLLVLGYYSQRELFEAVAVGQLIVVAAVSALGLIVQPPTVAHWDWPVVLAILGTGFFATAVTFALQTWGQRYTTATRAALIFALEPVFALLTAVTIGGERLTRYSTLGGCLILGGILIVELKPAKIA